MRLGKFFEIALRTAAYRTLQRRTRVKFSRMHIVRLAFRYNGLCETHDPLSDSGKIFVGQGLILLLRMQSQVSKD